jgi:hypothetical protein
MKKVSEKPRRRGAKTELRPEYSFDYAKSRRNRFTDRMERKSIAVVLDPDVASVFSDSTKVNALLRSVIKSLPGKKGAARATRSR